MKQLIIAEKPSVARNIADALNVGPARKNDGYMENDDYVVTWAYGHLLTLFDVKDYDDSLTAWRMENYPFFPDEFKYKIKDGAKKQFSIIKDIAVDNSIKSIVLATDNDREGQLIGELIFSKIGIRKPIYRLLKDSWTKEEVIDGMNHLISNTSMASLRDAGKARQQADWLIGINLTCAATLKYGGERRLYNIGRVILPTLKIVYDRDKEIENFISKDFYKLKANFVDGAKEYDGYYRKNKSEESSKFYTEEPLRNIMKQINGKSGVIVEKNVLKEKKYPDPLFNQTKLQGYITKNFDNWTGDKVLKVCQSLYEKKYLTYPRTESQALMSSSKANSEMLLNRLLKTVPSVKADFNIEGTRLKKIFNDKKVDSHEAIIPTLELPQKGELSADEQLIYDTVKNRFISQFMDPAVFEKTNIITDVDGFKFYTTGKVLIDFGFLKLLDKTIWNHNLPNVSKGDKVKVDDLKIEKKKTTPPKPMIEDELLSIMTNCGKKYTDEDAEAMSVLSGFSIGTAATRHEAIKKNVDIGYLERNKKQIHVTRLGRQLVEIFPVEQLFDLEYTGRLEQRLKQIEKNNETLDNFLNYIREFVEFSVEKVKETKTLIHSEDSIGSCPICGNDIVETKNNFSCTNNECRFALWKNDRFFERMKVEMTKEIAESFIHDKKAFIKGMTGKSGKKFDAVVKMEPKTQEDGKIYIDFTFDFNDESYFPVIGKCPICKADVAEKQKSFSCVNKNCNFVLWKEDRFLGSFGKKLNKKVAADFLKNGKSSFKKLIGKSGKEFDADILIEYEKKEDGKILTNYTFDFGKDNKKEYGAEVGHCPDCGGCVKERKFSYQCEKCGAVLFKNDKFLAALGQKLTPEMVEEIFTNGKSTIHNIKNNKNGTYNLTIIPKVVTSKGKKYYNWDTTYTS